MAGQDDNKAFIDSLDIKKGKSSKKQNKIPSEAKEPVIPHPGGRPTLYSLELADAICERLADGESMRSVCRSDSMPAMSSVFKWLREYPEFSEQYAKAKVESADALVEDMLDIADNQVEQPLLIDGIPFVHEGKILMIKDAVSVNHAKLRVDTRKWAASKLKPKKYGDKLELGTDPDNPLNVVTKIEIVAPKA